MRTPKPLPKYKKFKPPSAGAARRMRNQTVHQTTSEKIAEDINKKLRKMPRP